MTMNSNAKYCNDTKAPEGRENERTTLDGVATNSMGLSSYEIDNTNAQNASFNQMTDGRLASGIDVDSTFFEYRLGFGKSKCRKMITAGFGPS